MNCFYLTDVPTLNLMCVCLNGQKHPYYSIILLASDHKHANTRSTHKETHSVTFNGEMYRLERKWYGCYNGLSVKL